jgi:hypothetical protein
VRDARSAEESEAAEVELSPDAVTAEQRLEWKALCAFAEQAARDGLISPDGLRYAERLARGDTIEQLAEEEGVPAATVRKRMERMRKLLRAHWREATGLGGAVLGALLIFFLLRRPAEPGIVPEITVPPPAVSTAPPEETPVEKVTRLTNEAQERCDKRDYPYCEYLLDQAKEIDPDNEYKAPVAKMRRAIEDSTRKH